MPETSIIATTQNWLNQFIIRYQICPFAKPAYEQQRIRYQVMTEQNVENLLMAVIDECHYLDQHADTETTLLIFANACADFNDYLDVVAIAEQLLIEQGYEGVYQLASFHPDYCFSDSDPDDDANYTNRSPYPMLHIIREASIESALKHYPDPENIPVRNMQRCRQLGAAHILGLIK